MSCIVGTVSADTCTLAGWGSLKTGSKVMTISQRQQTNWAVSLSVQSRVQMPIHATTQSNVFSLIRHVDMSSDSRHERRYANAIIKSIRKPVIHVQRVTCRCHYIFVAIMPPSFPILKFKTPLSKPSSYIAQHVQVRV